MKKIYETLMAAGESISWASSGKRRGFVVFSVFFLVFLFGGNMTANAALGLNREAYGVWDREGGHSVATYPYTRGQEYAADWTDINPARSNFNWTAMDSLLQLAYDQNQRFFVKIQPVSATTVPPWIFSAGVPQINTTGLTYGYYLDPEFKIYFSEMVIALGKHLREDIPAHLRDIISLVRVDTGATGDEDPYDPADVGQVPSQYLISDADWLDYRIWVFGLYDQAFQHGTGPEIPLIFQDIETPAFAIEQGWVRTNVTSGFGAKYGGQVRGHHLSESRNVPDSYKAMSMDTPFKFFSANEMDQTWEKFYFQLNVPLSFYWCAAESLNAGLSIQDWSGSALEGAAANNFVFAAEFFNTWAAELDPPTARGGFCIFHEGLASDDTNKFPVATYGAANGNNTARYTAICAAYSNQGAQMDHLVAATWGQVAQRRDQNGFNDSGWEIWPGNYERFITQINPTNESVGLWRVRGTLTTSSHPYDRFARRFDRASNRNAMRFNVNDNLTPTSGQSIKLSVVYLDSGTNRFGLLYDAVGNSQKSAFTVTKANSNTWKTNSVVVTDWVFGNNGPYGSDLVLTNLDSSGDTTFNSIELTKLVNVTMNTVGSGTVSARTDSTVYSPVTGTNYATGQRLDMTVTPGSGYEFAGWSGDLSGSNSRAILFPTNVNTTVTATFANTGLLISQDNFSSTNFTGGTGWSGGWSTSGGALVELDADLNSLVAHLSANGQITRVAATPIGSGGQLTFRWKIKGLETGESAQAEVYNGSWHVVWFKESTLTELGTTNIDLSAYSNISQVRFTVNAGGGADNFYVDDVSLSGVVAKYTLTVNSGSGSGSYTNGAQVAILAYPVSGKTFYRWTGSTQVVNNVTYTNALVTMTTNAVTLTATYVDVYYALTVNSGTGGGSYTNGTVVAVTASNAPSGKVFDQWVGSGAQYLANASSASTTVTMPAQAISLTATYVDVYYTLTVNSGSGDGSYTNGTQVEITADAPAVGKAFDKWIGDTQYLAGATVTMPATNVTLTATYVDVYYELTVNSGSGDGSYTNGTQVAIAADVIVQKIFAAWTGDTQYVASVTASNTTVTMPAQAVVLTATYTDSAVYHLLTTSTGANGTIAPTNASVLAGDSTNFVITASNYYRIATLTTNGAAVTGMTFDNNSTTTNFIWSNVQTSGVLAATFTAQVTTNAPANVPYEWLAGYGLTNYNTDSTTDVDLDGLTAWQEYITGTDPTNTTSGFKAAQATRNTVTWSPVSGRVYSVYWSTNLVNGFQPLETNILYPQGSYTNLNAGPRVNLYQIKVRMQ